MKHCFGKGNLRKDEYRASILIFIFLELSSIFKSKSLNYNKFITAKISITRINLKLNNYFQLAKKLNLDSKFCNKLKKLFI